MSISVSERSDSDDGEFSLGSHVQAPYDGDMVILGPTMSIVGGFLFLGSLAAHIYARLRLRPPDDSDLDDYYHEFEDEHPGYARYSRWLNTTMAGAALGMLLLFGGVVF